MEPPALARQSLGEGQTAGLRIKTAQHSIERLHGDSEAVGLAQPFGNGMVHLGRGGAAGGGDPVGGLFERREMVGAVVEEVARLFIGQQDAPPRREGDASGVLAGDPPGAIKREHRARRFRTRAGQSGNFGFGHRVDTQQRIGESLAQPDLEPAFLRARERGEIEVEYFGELDQQCAADRALIVLDQIQIARRDAKPVRQCLLRQVPLSAQPPHRTPDLDTRHFTPFTKIGLGL